MNKLDLGKFWLMRLARSLPNASSRMRTRMAWHLAALSVRDDEALADLPEVALCRFAGGSPKFGELRMLYFRALSNSDETRRHSKSPMQIVRRAGRAAY